MEKIKKVPMRRCIGCRETKPKKELIRIVLSPENKIFIDLKGKANGRGTYICYNDKCFIEALKKKRISYALKTEIDTDELDRLKTEINVLLKQETMPGSGR
ncbi:MAG: YlxR family protein [Actinobacteria bacterium]|nr:YlxR family protein [Actinomycetota bacterium]